MILLLVRSNIGGDEKNSQKHVIRLCVMLKRQVLVDEENTLFAIWTANRDGERKQSVLAEPACWAIFAREGWFGFYPSSQSVNFPV